jgi:host factor-I protein
MRNNSLELSLTTKPPAKSAAAKAKARPAEQTFEEIRYLRHLIDQGITVCVKLIEGEEFTGVIEYYDFNFIRLTRTGEPNLFIFKHDIMYLYEAA